MAGITMQIDPFCTSQHSENPLELLIRCNSNPWLWDFPSLSIGQIHLHLKGLFGCIF